MLLHGLHFSFPPIRNTDRTVTNIADSFIGESNGSKISSTFDIRIEGRWAGLGVDFPPWLEQAGASLCRETRKRHGAALENVAGIGLRAFIRRRREFAAAA